MTQSHLSDTLDPVTKKQGTWERKRKRAIFTLADETLEAIERMKSEHGSNGSRVVDAAVRELAAKSPERVARALEAASEDAPDPAPKKSTRR